MFVEINIIKQGDGICRDDFDKGETKLLVNTDYIISLSEPERFDMPLSGDRTDLYYSVLSILDKKLIFISKHEYSNLCYILKDMC